MLIYNQVKRKQKKLKTENKNKTSFKGEQKNDEKIYKNKTCGVKHLQ